MIADVCEGREADVENGYAFPPEVIEGSAVTIKCNKGFRLEGPWEFICTNGSLGGRIRDEQSRCVPLTLGKFVSI